MRTRHLTALCGATALSALMTMPQAASAQTQPTSAGTPATSAVDAASDTDKAGEIIVTARRRNESIVDVPLAITVVTADKIEKLNLQSTRDIANFVPSLEFSDFTQGNSRNDRGPNRTIIFRGLNLANNGGTTTQAASVYLDGAAVIGNEIPAGLDIGAVEILRGPQNVYFGRASMTGAISYRTKAIPKSLGVETNLELAERQTMQVETSVAGPLVSDLLGFRLTGLYEKNDGYITNAYDPTGPRLGARSRRSLSGTLDFTPTSSIEVKGYANYFADEDNPSATVNIFPDAQYAPGGTVPSIYTEGAFVGLGTVDNCLKGRDVPTAAGTTYARATICGEVPDVSHAVAYSRTDIPANVAGALFNTTPFVSGEHFKHMAGTQRHAFNSQLVANFQISDYLKAQSITGYHVNTTVNFIDGAQQAVTPTSQYSVLFFGSVSKFRDFSQELRLSSDPERAFSWTVGSNFVQAKILSEAYNTTIANTPAQTFTPGAFNVADNRGTTYGFFAGAYLKLLDKKLTFSAEGRYQIDDRFAQTLLPANLAVLASSGIFDKKFKAFYPRVSVDYDVGGGKKVYASIAKGGRPGGFNSGLLTFLDPNNSKYTGCVVATGINCFTQTAAQINALFGTTATDYKQESLTIGELGFKGYLPGGKGYFDINAYYGIVNNQQVTQAQVITNLQPATTLSIIVNTGQTEIYGTEFTGNYNFTRSISLDATFAWNHTRRISYFDPSPGTIAQFGISDFRGLHLPLAPIITSSAVLSYEEPRSDHWSPFANAALVYRGKQYADIANYSYIEGRATVDLRLGAKNDRFRLEAFVTNLFDNKNYPAGNVAADFGINLVNGVRSSYSGFFGAYAEPRTAGVRANASF